MIRKIKSELIGHSGFFKVTILSSISSGLKILISFVVSKFLAIYSGPTGFAMIGQMNNFLSILYAIGSAGVNTGLTKYVSEYEGDDQIRNRFISSTIYLMLVFTSISGFFLIVFSSQISNYLFKTPNYSTYIVFVGVAMFFYNTGQIFLSVINGLKLFKTFIWVNILISFAGLISSVLLIWLFQMNGAIISVIVNLLFYFLVLWPFLRNAPWFNLNAFKPVFHSNETKKLISFTVMFLFSSTVMPVVQILLRGYLFSHFSQTDAGYWDSLNRISQIPVLILTTAFSTYYLPHLAQIKTKILMELEIKKTIRIIFPITFLILGFIYLFRVQLISIVFTDKFQPVANLLFWQLMGDLFRMLSFVFAYVLLAKVQTLYFVIGEVFFGIALYGISLFLLPAFGLFGITYAYCISYLLYLFLMIWFFYRSKWDG
jgi:PST family polysaccharide transporter